MGTVLALIPARGESKRLKDKNVRLVDGKPMIAYAINACKKSVLIDEVYVSTENDIIKNIAQGHGAKVIDRPRRLAEDNIPTQDVFKHFAEVVGDFDVLVCVQANSPNVKTESINLAISKLIKHNLWEVRSVNSEGLENGAIWVLKRKAIFWTGLSVYFGVVTDDAVDIHTIKDLKLAEDIIKNDKNKRDNNQL